MTTPAPETIPAAPAVGADVEVQIDGAAVKVSPAVAKALDAANKAAETAKTAAATAETARAAAEAKLPKEKAPANQADDLEVIIFSDPKEAIRRIKEEVTTSVRGELGVDRARDAFWSAFYDENPGLKDADLVVKAVMGREFESMRPMTTEKAREHLAEATEKELLRLGIQRKKGKGKPVGEGSNEPGAKVTKKGEGERPLTGGLSAVLRERAAARREQAAPPTT
jgi:hypothetical protein